MAIRGLFQKLFSQYNSSGLSVIKFSFRDSDDVWVRVSGEPQKSHPDISVVDAGAGLVILTYPKCRIATILSAKIDPQASTFGSQRRVEYAAISDTQAKAGSAPIWIYKDDDTSGVPGLLDPVDGSILTVVLWIAK